MPNKFPGPVSNRIAQNVTNHLLDKMAAHAARTDQRISEVDAKELGGPKAYQAFYQMAKSAMQGYEAKYGKVTTSDLRDPVKRGNILKTIALVDKDDDGLFEVPEVRSSASQRAGIILAAAEQFQRYSAANTDKGTFSGRVADAKSKAAQFQGAQQYQGAAQQYQGAAQQAS